MIGMITEVNESTRVMRKRKQRTSLDNVARHNLHFDHPHEIAQTINLHRVDDQRAHGLVQTHGQAFQERANAAGEGGIGANRHDVLVIMNH